MSRQENKDIRAEVFPGEPVPWAPEEEVMTKADKFNWATAVVPKLRDQKP